MKTPITFALLFLYFFCNAQSSKTDSTSILDDGLTIDEVTIVGRDQSKKTSLTAKIEIIDAKAIASSQPQTTADALSKNAAVFVQKSQMGGGSPNLRGFEANRLLLVVDGVRLNNAIYRSGHLQNALTIDPASLEKIEVLFGPSSLVYGSDALGGVIHFKTKQPKLYFGDKTIKINNSSFVRTSSANSEKTIHTDFNIASSKLASLTSFSFSKFGDLKSGKNHDARFPNFGKRDQYISRVNDQDKLIQNSNPYLQIGSAYQQFDFVQKFKYAINNHGSINANIQLSKSSNIPRYDALNESDGNGGLKYAEWNYGPQKRFLSSINYSTDFKNAFFDHIIAIAAYQSIEESRYTRRFQSTSRNVNIEHLDVFSVTVDLKKKMKYLDLKIGAELNQNNLISDGFEENITLGNARKNALSRYPSGGGKTKTIGIYGILEKQFSHNLLVNGGIRFSHYYQRIQYKKSDPFVWPETFYNGLTNSNSSLSFNAGVNQKISNTWTYKIGLSSAFKNPNIDDLSKIRIKANEISTPNLSLKPERASTLEGSLNYANNIIELEGVVFLTQVRDIIVRRPYPFPDGSTSLNDQGAILISYANVNEDHGTIWGGSLAGKINFGEFTGQSSLSFTRGYSKTKDMGTKNPLAHIPPIFGKNELAYNVHIFNLRFEHVFNGHKPLDQFGGGSDNPEFASPKGSLAWHTINLYINTSFNHFSILAGIENISNKHYRLFSSGISASGRNYLVTLMGDF